MSNSPDESAPHDESTSCDKPTPRLDAANWLEFVIDVQSNTLDRINTKSKRIARLLGILLGLVLLSLSLSLQSTEVTVNSFSLPTRLAFLIGVGLLLSALVDAIGTLLSSRYNIGLGHGVGNLLSRSDYDVSTETHLRRVLGIYAVNVRLNDRIIEMNARRLRQTLGSLLLGIIYLTLSVVFVVTGLEKGTEWILFVLSIPIAGTVGWSVLSEKHLPIRDE